MDHGFLWHAKLWLGTISRSTRGFSGCIFRPSPRADAVMTAWSSLIYGHLCFRGVISTPSSSSPFHRAPAHTCFWLEMLSRRLSWVTPCFYVHLSRIDPHAQKGYRCADFPRVLLSLRSSKRVLPFRWRIPFFRREYSPACKQKAHWRCWISL